MVSGRLSARAVGAVVIAVPLSQVLGGAMGGLFLGPRSDGVLFGWQWLFLVEGLPSILIDLIVARYLTESPSSWTIFRYIVKWSVPIYDMP